MAFGVELLVTLVTLLFGYVFWNRYKRRNLPPGPIGYPIVGSLPYVGKFSHCYYKNLSKEYGSNVISLKLGSTDVVVLNDWKSVKEVLLKQSELFSGRPSIFLWEATLAGEDLFTSQGPLWKERKRFTMHQLRDAGIGKQSMEEVIMAEVTKLISYIEESTDSRMEVTYLFFTCILSVANRITQGGTYDMNDKAIRNLSKAIKFNFECFKNDSPLNFMPYLRHIPGLTNFTQFVASHQSVNKLLQQTIDEHTDTYVEGNTRDFVDILLREMYKNQDKKPSENALKPENILGIMYNLYNGGVETTAHTLSFAFLYLSTWPEIQSKVQAEIDQLLGNGRLPTYSDRKLLPYTEATILETYRYSTVLPLAVPHTPYSTAKINGYTIPKGAFVMPNMWAIHNDPDLWGDLEVFRPDRFLDENGQVQKPEYLIPFSLGARFCPGEHLARMELFLFIASLLQRFSFRRITGQVPPSLEPIVGITQRPQSYSLTIKLRE